MESIHYVSCGGNAHDGGLYSFATRVSSWPHGSRRGRPVRGGVTPLREADRALDLTRRLRPDGSPERVERPVRRRVVRRLFGLALGYENLNDRDELRDDRLPTLADDDPGFWPVLGAVYNGSPSWYRLDWLRLPPTVAAQPAGGGRRGILYRSEPGRVARVRRSNRALAPLGRLEGPFVERFANASAIWT